MHFTTTTLFYVATQLALVSAVAIPAARDEQVQQMQTRAAPGGAIGGVAAILKDHAKFMAAPPTAEEEIPKEENNALREGHRQVHKSLYEMMGGKKADPDAADKAGDDKDDAGADKGKEDKEEGGKEEEDAA